MPYQKIEGLWTGPQDQQPGGRNWFALKTITVTVGEDVLLQLQKSRLTRKTKSEVVGRVITEDSVFVADIGRTSLPIYTGNLRGDQKLSKQVGTKRKDTSGKSIVMYQLERTDVVVFNPSDDDRDARRFVGLLWDPGVENGPDDDDRGLAILSRQPLRTG